MSNRSRVLVALTLAACASTPRAMLSAADDAWTAGVIVAAQRPVLTPAEFAALKRADACWRLAYAALSAALGEPVLAPLAGDAERCAGQDSQILPAESAPAP